MNEIKIGRDIIAIKKGDYILDNSACLQFCAGDRRTLKQEGHNVYTSLRIAEKYRAILKSIKVVEKNNLKYYFF